MNITLSTGMEWVGDSHSQRMCRRSNPAIFITSAAIRQTACQSRSGRLHARADFSRCDCDKKGEDASIALAFAVSTGAFHKRREKRAAR
jgi:hypothetical protein